MGEQVTSLLPFNATAQERALEAATARISDVPVLVRESWNPATCPEALLPWLAWAFSVDTWDDTLTVAQKRAVIASSFLVHARKGTRYAVLQSLAAVGVDAEIVEWWQQAPAAAPHTFRVDLETLPDGMTDARVDRLEAQIDEVKPVRSHFTIRLMTRAAAPLYVGAMMQDLLITTIYPHTP
jgi:phage tail P2-like protein